MEQIGLKSCVVFNTGPYTVLPDNSIYLYRSAKKLYSEANQGQGFQICGENLPLRIGHVIRRMRSGCKRIVNGIPMGDVRTYKL